MAEVDDVGLKLWKMADARRADRSSVFDPSWQNLSNYFRPSLSDINTEKTEGTTSWTQNIYDTNPIRAASTCSVGVRNWVTPSTEPWLGLVPPTNLPKQKAQLSARGQRLTQPQQTNETDELGQDEASRWCAEAASQLLQELSASSFYSVVQPFNLSACVFGTALMYCEEGKTQTLRFEQFKIGTYTVQENDQKIVDTVDRWFKLTLRQAAQRWGKENLPKKQQEAIDKGKWDTKFTYQHHVMPMEDFKALGGSIEDDEGIGASQMAFASIYQDDQTKQIIKTGGYHEMPYFCLRWASWGTEAVYGYSPAFETLPEARQINNVVQFSDALTELKAFPRFLVPDSQTGEVELAAGGVTTVRADDMQRGVKPEEWMTLGESGEVIAMIERKEKAINDAFFVDVFKALGMLMNKDMTATEVSQRVGEKLDQFTGTFDQYRTEVINLLVPRCIGIMIRGRKLREAPDALMVNPGNDPKAQPELALPKINIMSRVTLAMNEVKNVGVQKTLMTLQPLGEATAGSPRDIMDNFDLDEVARGTGRNYGMPEKMMRPLKQVMALRAERLKQMQEQQALEKAKLASESAKNLGKAPPRMQEQIMDQVGGGQN